MPAKISELEQAHTLGGQEEYEVVQDGESRRSTANDLKAFIAAAVNAGIFSAGLISERPEADGGQGIYVATDSTERRFYFDLEGAWVDIGLDALDKQKLDGIESGATADQTGSEIKSAYESEPDTNAYTDAEKASVAGLGTASTYDVGTAPGEIPTNADISGGGGSSLQYGTIQSTRGPAFDGVDYSDNVDFSIPAGVKRITVVFLDVSVTGGGRLLVQLGTSGGIENTGYVSNSTRLTGSSGDTVESSDGFIINCTYSNYFSGHMTLTRTESGSNIWISSHSGRAGAVSGTLFQTALGGGRKSLSGELDIIRLTFQFADSGSDNYDNGWVNILYE